MAMTYSYFPVYYKSIVDSKQSQSMVVFLIANQSEITDRVIKQK